MYRRPYPTKKKNLEPWIFKNLRFCINEYNFVLLYYCVERYCSIYSDYIPRIIGPGASRKIQFTISAH